MVTDVEILVVMAYVLMRANVHAVMDVDPEQLVEVTVPLVLVLLVDVSLHVKDIVCTIIVDLIVEEMMLLRLILVVNVHLLLVRPHVS